MVFNTLNDRAGDAGALQLRLLTAEQLRILTDGEEAPPPNEIRLVSPSVRGVVIIKAIIAMPSRRKEAAEALARTQCGSV